MRTTQRAAIVVGSNPAAVAVNRRTNTIYTANFGANTVSVINGATNTVTAKVPVGNFPHGVAVNIQTGLIYVTNAADNTVSVITP